MRHRICETEHLVAVERREQSTSTPWVFRKVSLNLPDLTPISWEALWMKRGREGSELPALPAWKAFVIQFSRDADSLSGTFSGRVEHLNSGRRAHFDSPEQLLAVLGKLLHEVGGGAS